MLYFITILLVFLVAYGVATNAILKPRKGSWSMLSDIFWHPYFNIFGELFVDDPDKGKVGLLLLENISDTIFISTMRVFFIKMIKYMVKVNCIYLKNEHSVKNTRTPKLYFVIIFLLMLCFMGTSPQSLYSACILLYSVYIRECTD